MLSSIFTSSASIFLQISPLYLTLTFFLFPPTLPAHPTFNHPPRLPPPNVPPFTPATEGQCGGGLPRRHRPPLPSRSTRVGRVLSMELHAASLKSRRRGSGGRSSSSPVSSSSPAACTSGGGEGRAAPSSRGGPLSLHAPRRPNRGVILVGRHQQLPAAIRCGAGDIPPSQRRQAVLRGSSGELRLPPSSRPPPSPTLPELAASACTWMHQRRGAGSRKMMTTSPSPFASVPHSYPGHPLLPPLPTHGARGRAERERAGWAPRQAPRPRWWSLWIPLDREDSRADAIPPASCRQGSPNRPHTGSHETKKTDR
jgi:hypothetical protein